MANSALPPAGAGLDAASQAQMEAATDNTVAGTPANAQYHPSAAKAWCYFDGTGTISINASYNVTSLTDNGTGNYDVNLTVSFSSTSYFTVAGTGVSASSNSISALPNSVSAILVTTNINAGGAEDLSTVNVIAFGDQ